MPFYPKISGFNPDSLFGVVFASNWQNNNVLWCQEATRENFRNAISCSHNLSVTCSLGKIITIFMQIS